MKKTSVIIALILVIGLAGLAFVLTSNKDDNSDSTTTTTTNNATSEESSESTSQNAANTIEYSSDGFSPSSITVKAGNTITIKNSSARVLQFNSGPHPEHTDNAELNVGTVSPGQSKQLTVTTKGTHSFHNHLDSAHTGTLIVE